MSTNNLEHLKDRPQGSLRTDSTTELQESSESSRPAEPSLSPASAPGQPTPASSPPSPFPHTPTNGSPVRGPQGSRAGRSRIVVIGIVILPSRTLAIQINMAINNVKNWLGQVRQDALQILHMSDSQLTQLTGLDILSDLEREARYALTGGTDPNTGDTQEGAAWVFDNIQRLTTLDVTAYSLHL